MTVGAPVDFGGAPGTWTPEHFYVAAAEACLMTTVLAIAGISKLNIKTYRSRAKGTLEFVEGEGFRMTGIELEPEIELFSDADRERALRLLEKAEKNCLIARSMTASVTVKPVILAAAQPAA